MSTGSSGRTSWTARGGSCPLCGRAVRMQRSFAVEPPGGVWIRVSRQTSCCGCLLKATWSGKMWGLPHNWREPWIQRPWSSWEALISGETLICWRDKSARHKQLGGFWYALMTNLWPRWSRSWQGEAVLQYFICTDMWDVKVRGSLSSSDYRMLEFRILRGGRWVDSRTSAPEFRRAGWDFRDLLARLPWDMAIERSPGELVAFKDV